MSVYVRPLAADLVDLATLLASANWTAMKFHLCKTNFTPTPASILTDYSAAEADFVGYSAQTVTFAGPHLDAAKNAVAEALVNFLCTSNATPNSLYTFYVTNTASSLLIFGGVLDGAPINIIGPGDGTSQLISAQLGQGTVETVG